MVLASPKIMTLPQAVHARQQLKDDGRRLVLTNGVFDLLHPGHISYLQQARALGEALWVALNSDESVRGLKGASRPIQPALDRAFSLSALGCVDGVIIFHELRLVEEIRQIKPDIYCKAGDYTLGTMNPQEREALQAVGADIQFMPFLPGYSTSQLISKIKGLAT